jgi:hypothetical protein
VWYLVIPCCYLFLNLLSCISPPTQKIISNQKSVCITFFHWVCSKLCCLILDFITLTRIEMNQTSCPKLLTCSCYWFDSEPEHRLSIFGFCGLA